ncbi:MAG: accessory factor UbiK family protein [Piscirickettsiaceae bacterium]|nr:accessory factor UbiK family protein [Piscirickettsiaceae bacterium]
MLDTRKIEEIAKNITSALPSYLIAIREDIEKYIHTALTATFDRLDLVTREEFDIQTQVMHRIREKLEELERVIAELEH